MSSCLIVVEEI